MNIIAHRGYSAKFPENTLASFQAAMDYGADMIELDVTLSKDNVPVVIHDDTVDRTTKKKGTVSSFTLQQLKDMDAGSWFHASFVDEKIPTLEEVLHLVAGKILLNVEIKKEAVQSEVKNGIEEQVLRLIEKYSMESTCIVSSFSMTPLQRIRDLNPKVSIAALFDHSLRDSDHHAIEVLQPSAIHLAIQHATTDDMDYASIHNLPIRLYTVNSISQMQKAQELCVDGIFTNEVENALKFFTKRK